MRRRRCGAMSVRSPLDQYGRITYLAAGCKAGRCKYCGPKKAEKLKKGIAQAAEEKGLTRFLKCKVRERVDDRELRMIRA
jgi:hypothetical protein